MSKFCDKCKARNVGCELIQQMSADIRKFRRKKDCFWRVSYFVIAIMGIAIVILCVFSLFVHTKDVIYTPTINCVINPDSSKTKATSTPQKLDYVVEHAKYEISAAFQNTFLQFGEKISAEYERKFATLLALLTILGIVFPIIIAFIQHKFSERDLDKIDESLIESKGAFQKAESALENVHTAMSQLREQKIATYESSGLIYYDLATKNGEDKSSSCLFFTMSIYFFLLAANEDINRLNPCISSLISKIHSDWESVNGEIDANFLLELEKTINLANEILVKYQNASIKQIRDELLTIKKQRKPKMSISKFEGPDEKSDIRTK